MAAVTIFPADVVCLMCGATMGTMSRTKKFELNPGITPLVFKGGLPVCSRCGGNLYLEPNSSVFARVEHIAPLGQSSTHGIAASSSE